MAKSRLRMRWMSLALAGATTLAGRAEERNDCVWLLDGSALHGGMAFLSPTDGLLWRHPNAAEALHFPFASLDSIQFTPSQSQAGGGQQSLCRFRFANGDEIYGKIVGMDEAFLEMETWFSGALRADRKQVRSIAFLQNGYEVLYEGPNSLDEWARSRGPNGWSYRDGMLNATNRGVIGRDMKLKGSASVAFDLRWEGTFQMTAALHTETFDHHIYSKGSYMFSLRPNAASIQRIHPGAGTTTLGDVVFTNLANQTKARFDLRSHRDKALFALLANNELIATWKDGRGFIAKGSGVSFSVWSSQPKLSLSRILVTEWDGVLESDWETAGDSAADGLLLINRDQPTGQIREIRDNRLRFHFRNRLEVDIPLERVRQIYLRQTELAVETPPDNEIRVSLAGGGNLSFALAEWTDAAIRGVSRTFGPVEFKPDSVRLAAFNLKHQRQKSPAALENSEDVWNFEMDE